MKRGNLSDQTDYIGEGHPLVCSRNALSADTRDVPVATMPIEDMFVPFRSRAGVQKGDSTQGPAGLGLQDAR